VGSRPIVLGHSPPHRPQASILPLLPSPSFPPPPSLPHQATCNAPTLIRTPTGRRRNPSPGPGRRPRWEG
jgi:hypothetical protein